MTNRSSHRSESPIFQLTSSRRGWLTSATGLTAYVIFQLTSSRRGWHNFFSVITWPLYFNSHPHEEDDPLSETAVLWSTYFNSHPHEEDDELFLSSRFGHNISTHILTKRMTAILNKNNLFKIAYYINNKHFISIVDIFFHFHIYF